MRKEFERRLLREQKLLAFVDKYHEREERAQATIAWGSMFASRDSMTESHLTQHDDPCTFHDRKKEGLFQSKTRSSVVRARALRKFKKRNN